MIAVTADTNIYVSAFAFAGLPRQLIQAAEDGRIRVSISEPISQELSRVLQLKFQWTVEEANEALLQLAGCTFIVRPTEKIGVLRDDPDNRVLECAVAAGSQFIVTGDNDFLQLGQYRGIQIVRVADLACSRKTPRIVVEFVTERRGTDEGQPVQRRTNYWDFARGGGWAENRGGVPPARHRRGHPLQMESQVRRDGSGRCQAA